MTDTSQFLTYQSF